MKNYFLFKHLLILLRGYIFIFLTATIFLFTTFEKSFSEENVFTVNNVEVEGVVDLNFSREKYLNKAFLNSFKILMSQILLTRDLNKINNVKLKQIKNLINSFQILKENYSKDEYKLNIKILYNDIKVKKFLNKINISFSEPTKISVIFYPILIVNNEMKNFNENYFYREWINIKIKNEIINFILPLEDLEDISKIIKMKNKIEELNVNSLVNKYNIKNYIFALMNYQNGKLHIYLKTNFNNSKISKNISYKVKNINDQLELNFVLKDLKLKITDLWKSENLINLSMPLSVEFKFKHSNLQNLNKLRKTLKQISVVDNYILKEFDVNNAFFKIYYYGNPKKLKSEFLKNGYQLKNDQGSWKLYLNE